MRISLRSYIATLVVTVWSLTAVDGMITSDYTGLGIVTPVMMLIGGFIFGIRHEEQRQIKEAGDDLSDW